MKRTSGLLVTLILAVIFSSGCQTAQAPSGGTTSIPIDTAASAVGYLAMASASPLSTGSSVGVSTLGISSAGIKPFSSTPSFDSDGWIVISTSESVPGYGSFSIDIKAEVFGEAIGHIDSEDKMDQYISSRDTLEAIFMYAVTDYDLISPEAISFSVNLGNSKTDPLKLEALNTPTLKITGPAGYSGTYGTESFSVSMSYSALTVSATTGCPVGAVAFMVTSGTATAFSGTITYNGTSTATIVFSGGETYTVDLSTGEVS